MFLNYEQIKGMGLHKNEEGIQSSSLILHVSKMFVNGEEKELIGDSVTMGGYEYPRHMTFITKEKMDLDESTLGLVFGRQTCALKNILVFPGLVHPGYNKRLLLQVICLGPSAVIRKGDAIAYVAFAKTDSKNAKPIDMNKFTERTGLK